MTMLKDSQTIKQLAENILRNYLIRCFKTVSKQYPHVATMSPEEGAEELIKLQKEKKITIELKSEGDTLKCYINQYH